MVQQDAKKSDLERLIILSGRTSVVFVKQYESDFETPVCPQGPLVL